MLAFGLSHEAAHGPARFRSDYLSDLMRVRTGIGQNQIPCFQIDLEVVLHKGLICF